MNHLPRIEQARQTLREETYREVWRTLHTTYIYGKTGVGKTRHVMDKHGYANVYRVTNYDHPFDGYRGQSVVLFDEFRCSLTSMDMLKYLEGYPLMLPATPTRSLASPRYISSAISLSTTSILMCR